jgi:Lipase (class 3)
MASMAERIWIKSGPFIVELLRQNLGYELIVTGHSLGAGTACLLNILCHQDGRARIEGRSVRCFAYAAPPVFAPLNAIPEAMAACTNYIHEDDAVSFLSVDSVRHLFASISTIGHATERMGWASRLGLVTGWSQPDALLVARVEQAAAQRLEPKLGAPVLAIPAASVVWMREKKRNGKTDAKLCDPIRLSTLGVFVHANMFLDHFPPRYEHALHQMEGRDDE